MTPMAWWASKVPTFSDHLSWDVVRESVDPGLHGACLVRRVPEYGRWDDFLKLTECYGKTAVGRLATTLRCLEPRAMNFCSLYFGIPKSEFRCSIPMASQLPS